MSSAQKLTKKQKKALAFRERKGKGKAKDFDALDNDKIRRDAWSLQRRREGGCGRGGSGKQAKRKRGDGDAVDSVAEKPKPKKKRKGGDGKEVSTEADEDAAAKAGEKAGKDTTKVKQRYILFVGNLKFTTTKEDVEKHFAQCDPPPAVRLMKPKPTNLAKPTAKSKGFAFLEFSHRNALQQALKLHQSELEGRKINVELTAGGGGKSTARLDKLKKRNRELHEQRIKHVEKHRSSKGDDGDVQVERPQRYSRHLAWIKCRQEGGRGLFPNPLRKVNQRNGVKRARSVHHLH
ncbi:hypothetical protein A0H81_00802 [Grifola frondosa]|uniref:RRM domain-containing protein n=1 Tax=Grifola frondosa TaxID=5627 RepID=A0A1C7MST5_GRIFR|nr:hypothetical protein A0H81_00802 [Grifola frondosa]